MSGVQQLLTDNSEVVGLYLLMSRLGLQHDSSYTAESSAKLALSRGAPNDKVKLDRETVISVGGSGAWAYKAERFREGLSISVLLV